MIDLRPDCLEMVQKILRKHVPGIPVWAFGSRATWTAKDHSDLDLAVITEKPLDGKVMSDLKEAFSKSDLPMRVDVVDWAETSEEFRGVIREKYEVVQEGSSQIKGKGPWPKEWCEWPFQDVIDFQEGPGILAKDFHPTGVPLIRLSGLERGASPLEGCNFLDPTMVQKKWAHFRVRVGDVLLSTSASLGRTAVVDAPAEGAIPYTGIIRMRPKDHRLFFSFIPFLLQAPYFQCQIEAVGVGSVLRHFGPSHLKRMKVVLPPVPEQRAIAHILGTLDDKIELNRRTNETLEAMARALFRSWFVDFDPVHAKAEGRDPGFPKEISDLFPDSFEDSELGEIPKGWGVRGLDKIAHFLNGLPLQKYPPKNGCFLPVIKITQLRAGNADGADAASADLEPDYVVKDGDVLFSWSGSLECVLWTGGNGALNQHLFKVTSTSFPKWFYYFWIHEHLLHFRHVAAGKATTMGHIQRHHLSDAKVVVPDEETLDVASDTLSPLIERMIAAQIESRALIALRDALLPKLISGEIPAPDIERLAGRTQ